MIAWLVGKCHVSETYIEVLRFVISKLKNGKEQWRKLSRNDRRDAMRAIFKAHRENRELYGYVMSGGHGYARNKKDRAKKDAVTAQIRAWLLKAGARQRPDGSGYEYELDTAAGILFVSPEDGDWIACRFAEVERAKKILPHNLTNNDRLNPYSGKWNFTVTCNGEWDGMMALRYLKEELRKIGNDVPDVDL